ncbi:uncharacterized protein [Gossypium hirsutum]|uniref:Integrase catalytic domain-containing protein n=1 Tax=Gossypium hirsutum TaxID=3635 RepID=A0A1U8PB89_GOSHI|nr:uncharacterized protein LOC107956349 [Gossypium hirsutum]
MPFGDFDVILGMDWLAEHGVILDCYKKKFSAQTEDGDSVEVNGIRTSGLARIISAIKVNKLLHQGCIAYLAYVINSDSVGSQCSQIRTICEFRDVFPKKLPGLPPDREVEFAIEVYLGTDLVSIPPYRMSPTELKELKAQLQDLLERDGIRVDPKKIEAIVQWKTPRNVLEMLTEALVLTLPESEKDFMVFSDASLNGLECILMQNGKVIAYASRQLKPHERKANAVANALSRKAAIELRAMFAQLSISDDREHQVPTGLLQPITIPEWKWDRVTMDFITGLPLSISKKNAIWVIVDRLTKSAHFIAVRTDWSLQKLAEVYIREIIRLHGIPASIISDRDPRFTSRFWKQLHESLDSALCMLNTVTVTATATATVADY